MTPGERAQVWFGFVDAKVAYAHLDTTVILKHFGRENDLMHVSE
jgi:hypothetical protein